MECDMYLNYVITSHQPQKTEEETAVSGKWKYLDIFVFHRQSRSFRLGYPSHISGTNFAPGIQKHAKACQPLYHCVHFTTDGFGDL